MQYLLWSAALLLYLGLTVLQLLCLSALPTVFLLRLRQMSRSVDADSVARVD